jgi:hypothetical protein
MGFVDDEDGLLPCFGDQAGDFGADDARRPGAIAFWGHAEFPGDGLVHIHDVTVGQSDVEHAEQSGVEGGGEFAADGGFTGADLAGEQADAFEFEEVIQAGFGF